jgi:hypothetical protein
VPYRIVDALERWRTAERWLVAAAHGSVDWYEATLEVRLARDEYYRIADQVANEMVEE